VWPRPYQQPHPPIWIPSQGSRETIEFAAHPSRKYTYLQTFTPISVVQRFMQMYKDVAKGFGYTAEPRQLGWAIPIYVGETDAKAIAEARPHYEMFRNVLLKFPMEFTLPPGYTSRASQKALWAARSEFNVSEIERHMELGMFICGSAKTVREKLAGYVRDMGIGNVLTMLQFGSLPADLTRASMDRFAKEVMPHVKAEGKAFVGDVERADQVGVA
jgi:alkanesulfonate monooxygenase SsuD/methylene tetrahydromethanopterin reductase-like flavin-dependent oxidoreductase (luciferase family)